MTRGQCIVCHKTFYCKSTLNRHVKNIHGDRGEKDVRGEALSIDFPRQGEMDKFDVPRQMGGVDSYDDVQSTSQTNFENVGEQVDFDDGLTVDRNASHSYGYYGTPEPSDSGEFDTPEQSGGTNFENTDNQVDVGSGDDDRSMICNVGSGTESDDSTQHSDSSRGDDGESFNRLESIYSFWRLEMVKKMKEWSGVKIKRAAPSVFYYLTLMSRVLSRNSVLKSIMATADYFRDMYCSPSNYEALGYAVSKRQGVIHDVLTATAEEAEMESDDASSDGSDREFDMWGFINDILDDENVSGSARTKRSVELILFYMRTADAWRCDDFYGSIRKIVKQKRKRMSLRKALKYAISHEKFQILRILKLGRPDDDDESESDNDDEYESDYDGYEILKKLAPTATDRESESDDEDESNSESENDDDRDDKSNSESENDDVDKEKVSKPYNPYIDYYVNQALTCQTYPAEKLCPYCVQRYSGKTCPNCDRP